MGFFDTAFELGKKAANGAANRMQAVQEQYNKYYDKYSRMSDSELKSIIKSVRSGNKHFMQAEAPAFKKVCQERGFID